MFVSILVLPDRDAPPRSPSASSSGIRFTRQEKLCYWRRPLRRSPMHRMPTITQKIDRLGSPERIDACAREAGGI
jgi:hypothetical protein